MNFYISAEELAQRKHINFSVDLDESGLLISSCPQEIVTPTLVQQPAAGLLTDLNHLTWGELDAIGRSKKARQQIAVGAVKTDHMKNGFAAEYRIIGFDHDDLADGSGKAPFSWEAVRIYKERRPWNSEYLNAQGMSDTVIAGILGNMMTECGGQTLDLQWDIYGFDGSYYYGLCQWSLYYNPSVDGADVMGQLDYLMSNIRTNMNYFGGDFDDFCTITDPGSAAKYFCNYYERGAGASIRAANAENVARVDHKQLEWYRR